MNEPWADFITVADPDLQNRGGGGGVGGAGAGHPDSEIRLGLVMSRAITSSLEHRQR